MASIDMVETTSKEAALPTTSSGPRRGRPRICTCAIPKWSKDPTTGRIVCSTCAGVPRKGATITMKEPEPMPAKPDYPGPRGAEEMHMEVSEVPVIAEPTVIKEAAAIVEKSWTPALDDFVDIKGKAYLPARRRVQWMRGEPVAHPDWTIDTEIVEHIIGKLVKPGAVGVAKVDEGYALLRASIYDADGRLIATGLKSEYSENFPDYLEKAETGAIARALAVAGYGTESALDLDEGVDAERIADAPVGRPVRVGPSTVPGISRGGRTEGVSVAQIRRVAELSKGLGLGPLGLSAVVENIMGKKVPDLGSTDEEQSHNMAVFLADQGGRDVGTLIAALEATPAKAE